MAFPVTPLPVHVYIAPGADPASDPGGWTWDEITNDVRVADGIVITAGRSDEASHVDAGKCTMTLDNRSGNYAPRNPAGIYYGSLSKNTPLQVRLERGLDTYQRVRASGWGTADSGQNWGHSNTATWTIDGTKGVKTHATTNSVDIAVLGGANAHDVDLMFKCSVPVVTTGGPMRVGAMLRYTNTSNLYLPFIEFQPAGVLKLYFTKTIAGVFSGVFSTTLAITYAANDIICMRAQADGPTIRIRIWKNSVAEPTTWDYTTDDATELKYTGVGLYTWRDAGNTNAGTFTTNFYHFETTSLMFTGTVAEWPIRWDMSGNDCVSSIEAAGIIRRLSQSKAALRSPLYRQLTGYNPAGYWPMEDGKDATSVSPAAINGNPASAVDVTFADDDSLPGAGAVLKLNSAGSSIRGRVFRSTGTGFSAMFLMKLAAMPAAMTTFIEWSCSGTGKTYRLKGDATLLYSEVLSADGTVLASDSSAYAVTPTEWVAYQFEAVLTGGNVDWAMLWHQVGSASFFFHNGPFAGSVGTITGFSIPGSAGMVDAHVCHVYAGADTLPFVDSRFVLVSEGYSGELAADRVQRLCDEEGVRVYVETGTSEPMGRQRTLSFLDLLRACEDSDLGLLYESGAALGYKPQGARVGAISEGGLDFALGDVADPPEPTDDDQNVRNDVTVKRDSGGEYRAADEAHIALVGKYEITVDTNVDDDDQLPDLAGWLLHVGTWDEMRWPHITFDLARNPSRIGRWHSLMRPGARFTIANPPEQVTGDTLDLLVEGYTQTLSFYQWDIDVNCSPARVWDVALTDSTAWRVDTDGSTLATAVSASATSLSVTAVDRFLWTVDPAEVPFDVNLGGERVTVTAIAGTSNPQTFTVTRSVNGVILAHPVGTDIRLWTPAYVSL